MRRLGTGDQANEERVRDVPDEHIRPILVRHRRYHFVGHLGRRLGNHMVEFVAGNPYLDVGCVRVPIDPKRGLRPKAHVRCTVDDDYPDRRPVAFAVRIRSVELEAPLLLKCLRVPAGGNTSCRREESAARAEMRFIRTPRLDDVVRLMARGAWESQEERRLGRYLVGYGCRPGARTSIPHLARLNGPPIWRRRQGRSNKRNESAGIYAPDSGVLLWFILTLGQNREQTGSPRVIQAASLPMATLNRTWQVQPASSVLARLRSSGFHFDSTVAHAGSHYPKPCLSDFHSRIAVVPRERRLLDHARQSCEADGHLRGGVLYDNIGNVIAVVPHDNLNSQSKPA